MRVPALRTLVAVTAVTAGALLTTGCSAFRPVTELAAPVRSSLYATVAEADGTLPGWLPEDAAQIRIKASNSTPASIMTYSSPTLYPVELCTASAAPPEPPELSDTWWPQEIPAETVTCPDGWHAFAAGERVFAWTGLQPSSLAQ